MNKQKLLTFINNPKAISQGDLEELEQLVEQYPYFQIGHALIAKVKSDNKTLDNRDKIHLAAIATADRNVLKNFIKDQSYNTPDTFVAEETQEVIYTETINQSDPITDQSADNTLTEEITVTETFESTISTPYEADEQLADNSSEQGGIEEVADQNISNENIETNTETSATGAVEQDETSSDNKEDIPLGDLSIKKSSDADKSKVSITDDTKEQDDPKDNLYKELEENLKSLQKRKVKSESEAKKAATSEKKAPTGSDDTATKKSTATKTTAKKATTRTSRTSTKSTTSKAANSSTSPRKTTASKTSGAKKTGATTKKSTGTTKATSTSTKATETSKKKLQKNVEKDKESKKKDKNSGSDENKDKQTEIIEEFIKKEPTIAKPKLTKGQDNVPQEDLSLKSVEIKEDLISENLAIIMEKQGKIQKAKDIYKKLIWKFPQKKTYFASRIEELERS